jgi:hypothetical protein
MAERLDRFARRLGNGMTRSRAGLLLLEEGLRETEFAFIEFRNSPLGRQAYMAESGLAVWEVIMVAKDHEMDSERVARYFNRPIEWVKSAFNYYESYREEIDPSIEDNDIEYEELKRLLPNAELHEVPRDVFIGADES